MHRTELTSSDIAELEKERKGLQLTTTDYLLKVNEIRTRRGVDLLENLMKFYQSQVKYFQDGLQVHIKAPHQTLQWQEKITVFAKHTFTFCFSIKS